MSEIVKQKETSAVALPDGFDDFFGSVAAEAAGTLSASSVAALVPVVHVGKDPVFLSPDIIGEVEGISTKKISGIVLFPRTTRQLWQRDEQGNAATDDNGDVMPPACQSVDGIMGCGDFTGNQPRACVTCPAAKWGAAANGESERPPCSERRALAVLPDGSDVAVLVDCAPTSTRAVDMAVGVLSVKQRKGEGFGRQRVDLSLAKKDKGPFNWFELVVDFVGVETDSGRQVAAFTAAKDLKGLIDQVDSSRQTIGEVFE